MRVSVRRISSEPAGDRELSDYAAVWFRRRRRRPIEDADAATVIRHGSTFVVCAIEHLTLAPGYHRVVPQVMLRELSHEELGGAVLRALESNRRRVETSEDELRADHDDIPDLLGLRSTAQVAAKAERLSVSRTSETSLELVRMRPRDAAPVTYGAERSIVAFDTTEDLGAALIAFLDA